MLTLIAISTVVLAAFRSVCLAAATSRYVMSEKSATVAAALALIFATTAPEPAAAQQVRAGLLTCDVSAGIGLIVTSQKALYCTFAPDRPGIMREDYDGTITKYGLDLGVVAGGIMVWAVFTETVAGPGFLAGDYVGASGEASLGAGIGANVLVGGSNRTVTLQPVSVSGQIGVNIALGVGSLRLGLPTR
jgi:hypothetical protein